MEHQQIKVSLRARRAELLAELTRLTEPPPEGSTVSFGKRIGEGTTEAVERLSTTATARALSASLAEIDEALERIADGTYGTCRECGRPIPPERLEALPATSQCVECRRTS